MFPWCGIYIYNNHVNVCKRTVQCVTDVDNYWGWCNRLQQQRRHHRNQDDTTACGGGVSSECKDQFQGCVKHLAQYGRVYMRRLAIITVVITLCRSMRWVPSNASTPNAWVGVLVSAIITIHHPSTPWRCCQTNYERPNTRRRRRDSDSAVIPKQLVCAL